MYVWFAAERVQEFGTNGWLGCMYIWLLPFYTPSPGMCTDTKACAAPEGDWGVSMATSNDDLRAADAPRAMDRRRLLRLASAFALASLPARAAVLPVDGQEQDTAGSETDCPDGSGATGSSEESGLEPQGDTYGSGDDETGGDTYDNCETTGDPMPISAPPPASFGKRDRKRRKKNRRNGRKRGNRR